MKTRILLFVPIALMVLWACDEPPAYENEALVYNPFTIKQDTISAVQSISGGRASVDWGSHLRAVIGETDYYRTGLVIDFDLRDTSLDVAAADSIALQLRHSTTYPGDPTAAEYADTLVNFAVYELQDSDLDIFQDDLGLPIMTAQQNINGGDNYWSFTLPQLSLDTSDSIKTYAVLMAQTDYMSFIYGGGSSLGPQLIFYGHEADTSGQDVVTTQSVGSDSVQVHIMEQADTFNAPGTLYMSQLFQDSLVFNFDLSHVADRGDTLVEFVRCEFLPGIMLSESAIYRLGSTDSLYQMRVQDPRSEYATTLQLNTTGAFVSNEINGILQVTIDDQESQLQLILRPNHIGFDPGVIAVSTDRDSSLIAMVRALAVRP